jgi:hypothetical protein
VRTRLLVATNLALATALAWTLLGQPAASGAGAPQVVAIAAPAFTPLGYSTHNGPSSSVCPKNPSGGGTFVPHSPIDDTHSGESRGQLDNAAGSFAAFLRLPNGVTLTRFSVSVNDADTDADVFAYLVRRDIAKNLDKDLGYKVLASAHSQGSVVNVIRRFDDTTIAAHVVDNSHYDYYVELVDCGIPEPFAIQVAYTA